MRRTIVLAVTVSALACGSAFAGPDPRGGAPQLGQIMKRAQQARELVITEADEIRIGEAVSEKVRARYGVVQDAAVHRYVTLVGAVLAVSGKRPGLPWKFIVLDTDGVNAFAAPGGFIHITRGALGLLASEAELAGVLAHEIEHVDQKHTVEALQKSKGVQITTDELVGDKAVFARLVETATEAVLAGFGRKEELESTGRGCAWRTRSATTRTVSRLSSSGCPIGTSRPPRSRACSRRTRKCRSGWTCSRSRWRPRN